MVKLVTPKTKRIDAIYSDFRKDFIPNLISSDVAKKTDEDAIKESIRNIVMTDIGERLFQPEFGCDIRRLLFENFTPITKRSIESNIKNAIQQYEPRCLLSSVNAQPDSDDNTITVNIIFNVINIPDEISLSLVLERVK